jgi:hypothetical protein
VSDWDAIFGEAALGLDLAKADPAQPGRQHRRAAAPTGGKSATAPPGSKSAAVAAGSKSAAVAASPVPSARPSLKLASRPKAPTASREAIFRREALEFRVRGRDTPGGVVRLGSRWIRWAYRMTLVLVVAAVAGLWVIHTDEGTTGPAIINGRTGTVTLLLPAAAAPDLASSRETTVVLPGGRSLEITGLHVELSGDAAIRNAGFTPLTQPAVLVTGQLVPAGAPALVLRDANRQTLASVVLRSESLADLLARQFRAMVTNGTSP